MANREIQATWEYHNQTKHSYRSVRSDPHYLDWSNEPRLFKVYPALDPIPLPKDPAPTGIPALSAIGSRGVPPEKETRMNLEDLASLFRFSCGITRRRSYPGREILFRAAACTGALYSIELYAVCGALADLEAGVYLFSPLDFSLRQLRSGDYRGVLARATAHDPSVVRAPVTIICTGTHWRNAWKYQARTYRHFGWDNGMILANLLAISAAKKLPAKVIHGFVDSEVNRLLDLETEREVALNLVPVGYVAEAASDFSDDLSPLHLETLPYSNFEIDYPAMREMHDASSLHTPEEVAAWRGATPLIPLPPPSGKNIPLRPHPVDEMPKDPIEQVIQRRGSSRRFVRESLTFQQFSTALFLSTQGLQMDFLEPPGAQLNDLYVVVHAIDGLQPGAYVLHRDPWALELLKEGDFRSKTGYLGLEQELPADCSAAIFFLASLTPILNRFGNRGYRATQLEAGVIGGRLYLAAYAQRFGATGLTFYDDEVTSFFSPHAEGKSAIFLVALGRAAKVIQGW